MPAHRPDRIAVAALCWLAASAAAGAALPDPTQPYGYSRAVEVAQPAPGGGVEWTLNGIRIRNDMRSAIVNGQLVREGDEINNATVVEIGKSTVILSHDHRRVVVRLLIPEVKRRIDDPKPAGEADAE